MFSIFIIGLLAGGFIGTLVYIAFGQIKESIIKPNKFDVVFTLSYLNHPYGELTKGQIVKTKPMTIRVSAKSAEEAIDFARVIINDEVRIEIEDIQIVEDADEK